MIEASLRDPVGHGTAVAQTVSRLCGQVSITSVQFQHRRATAAELLVAERSPTRIGTFLLTQRGSIIACVVIDERIDDGVRVATLSKAEVHPDHDRIQTLWNHLCTPLIRAFSYGSFGRLEVEVEIPEDEPLLQMGFARAESERGLVWRKVISR